MDGKRFLNSVKFTNLLSFGPEGMELELQPLNVLIGANGSGKSNFIDAIRILQAIPIDLSIPFSKGDIATDWLWKGIGEKASDFSLYVNLQENDLFCEYNALLSCVKGRAIFKEESVVKKRKIPLKRIVSIGNPDVDLIKEIIKNDSPLNYNKSFINKEDYYQKLQNVRFLIMKMKDIRLYSDYELGRYSKIRMPQNASLDPGDIFEGFGNLSLVINDLISKPEILDVIIEKMKIFYDGIVNVNTRTAFGTIQLYLQEKGFSETIPATRLSDGTIRFLSLLAILLHPEPPPLICIEEPEIGMHPDIIHVIADLLVEASQRTQIIITTHSDILVSAIGNSHPETIVVCEKDEQGTKMKRLDPEKMKVWLEKYSMGELWISGDIGGGRW